MGFNVQDQTTVPVAAQSGVTAIAAGSFHTVALVSTPTITTSSSGDNLTLLWPAAMTGYRKGVLTESM